mmetsp:Transcript_32060/g.74889  ORF Transcript_32060/g.74889 Transcript_32060/m.74889 type:complete len:155 (+) Transcript_32060:30-494(+)
MAALWRAVPSRLPHLPRFRLGHLRSSWPSIERQDCPGAGCGLFALTAVRSSYKFAPPPSPNLVALRKILTERLVPVHFYLRNNLTFCNYVWDMHFIGICCSPKFEGKSHKEINKMVEDICAEVGMQGRVQMICHPPSRWHMMRRRARRRWDFDW